MYEKALKLDPEDTETLYQLGLSYLAQGNKGKATEMYGRLPNSSNILKLKAIKGIGQKTADYFKILVGISTCAIDRHLLNFLDFAGLTDNEYSQAQDVINSTADLLSIDRAHFDHSIWQYMSKRVIKPKKPKTRCKDH